MSQSLKKNKNNVVSFYKMAYEGNPRKAVELFVGEFITGEQAEIGILKLATGRLNIVMFCMNKME